MRRRGNGEGSYFKQTRQLAGGGTTTFFVYQISLGFDEYGRRIRRKFVGPTKAEAKLKADRARAAAGGKLTARPARTVQEYLEEWLAEVQISRASRTAASYEAPLRRFVFPNLGKTRLEELDQRAISRFYADLSLRGHSADTIAKTHKVLRRAFNVAIGKGLIGRNPTAFVERPRHRPKKRASYCAAELLALFEAIKGDQLEALFRLAPVTAMRPGELYALERADVDLDRGHIDVRNSLEDVGGVLSIVPAKADSARRIPITPATIAIMRDHFARLDTAASTKASQYAFPSPRGKWLRTGPVNQALKAACRRAGLPPLDLYGLRHSGLSLLSEAGVSIRVAADVAGHAGTTITNDVYTHSTVALVREGVERAEIVLFSATRVEPPVEPETVGITENAEESDCSGG